MKEIHDEIIINVDPVRVWEVIMDFNSYPGWNSLIEISGVAQEGEHLDITIKPPDEEEVTYRAEVLKLDPEREFRWQENMWKDDLAFISEHYIILEPMLNKTTKLIHGIKFTGILTPDIENYIDDNIRRGVDEFDLALKHESEKILVTPSGLP
jgi:hypothetical protein